MVCHLLRNEALQLIAKFLCEFEDLPLRFDESSESYYVTDIMTSTTSEENQETGNEIDEVGLGRVVGVVVAVKEKVIKCSVGVDYNFTSVTCKKTLHSLFNTG